MHQHNGDLDTSQQVNHIEKEHAYLTTFIQVSLVSDQHNLQKRIFAVLANEIDPKLSTTHKQRITLCVDCYLGPSTERTGTRSNDLLSEMSYTTMAQFAPRQYIGLIEW
mgnify:CR=1 FL=1